MYLASEPEVGFWKYWDLKNISIRLKKTKKNNLTLDDSHVFDKVTTVLRFGGVEEFADELGQKNQNVFLKK